LAANHNRGLVVATVLLAVLDNASRAFAQKKRPTGPWLHAANLR